MCSLRSFDTSRHGHGKLLKLNGDANIVIIRWALKPLVFIIIMVMVLSAGQATLQLYREKSRIRRQLNQTQQRVQTVERQRLDLLKQSQDLKNRNTDVQKQLDQKVLEEQQLQQQVNDLQAAKAARQNQYIALSQSAAATAALRPSGASGAVANCGDNDYANFIYRRESGCNTCKVNGGAIDCAYTGSRAWGIGQSYPASNISYCGADYACQNAYFTDYANRAYGGWAGAYTFWVQHSWW